MPLIPGIENVNWMGAVGNVAIYVFWGFMLLFVAFAMFFIYHVTSYKIKATVLTLTGSGVTESKYTIGTIKTNRFRWNRNKTAWIALYPLFNKKEIEPFESKFIYHKNHVFAFSLPDGSFIPGNASLDSKEGQSLEMSINPIPKYLRRGEEVEMLNDEMQYNVKSGWDKYGNVVTIMVAGLICLVMVLGTVYFTYKFSAGGVDAMSRLSASIDRLGTIPGVGAR